MSEINISELSNLELANIVKMYSPTERIYRMAVDELVKRNQQIIGAGQNTVRDLQRGSPLTRQEAPKSVSPSDSSKFKSVNKAERAKKSGRAQT